MPCFSVSAVDWTASLVVQDSHTRLFVVVYLVIEH